MTNIKNDDLDLLIEEEIHDNAEIVLDDDSSSRNIKPSVSDDDEDYEINPYDDDAEDFGSDKENKAAKLGRAARRSRNNKAARARAEALAAMNAEKARLLEDKIARLEKQQEGIQDLAVRYQHDVLNTKLLEAENAVKYYEAEVAKSASNGDADGVQRALHLMRKGQEELNKFSYERERIKSTQTSQPQYQQGEDLLNHPATTFYRNQFLEKNPWYFDPSATSDVALLRMLDQQIERNGEKPNTPAYWAKLDQDARKYLPHRYEEDQPMDTRPSKKNIVSSTITNGSNTDEGIRKGMKFEPHQINALIRMGHLGEDRKTVKNAEKVKEYYKSFQETKARGDK